MNSHNHLGDIVQYPKDHLHHLYSKQNHNLASLSDPIILNFIIHTTRLNLICNSIRLIVITRPTASRLDVNLDTFFSIKWNIYDYGELHNPQLKDCCNDFTFRIVPAIFNFPDQNNLITILRHNHFHSQLYLYELQPTSETIPLIVYTNTTA